MVGIGLVCIEGDILDQAVNFNLVQKSGTWFSYGETRLGQGRENVKRYLQEDEKLLTEMESKVRGKLGLAAGTKEEKSDQKAPVGESKAPVTEN